MRECRGADRQRDAARFIELAHDLADLRERVARVDVEAEQLAELRDDEHHGDPVEVADQDGTREVVGKPAEA